MAEQNVPIQPVEKPILCGPYTEPNDHWIYEKGTGHAKHAGTRRPAGYWYKTEKTGSAQQQLFVEEERDDLPLVNLLRDEVRRWREADYRGATNVTKDLLRYWAREDRPRRLFFCQREAVETIIYLAELRIPGKSSRTGFQKFPLSDEDLGKLLRGERPGFDLSAADFFPTLVDPSGNPDLIPLRRLGCKMATGSGKTVVMSMLIAWAFCNRGQNLASREFPSAVIVCCPNLTVKERLQVLRPETEDNYYVAFDIVPVKYRPLLQVGKVLVTNWHAFAMESEHKEGEKTYAVVNKGPETPQTFARRVLGDLYDRMPIMVLNDEGHHCWRPAATDESLSGEEKKELSEEAEEARIWARGLDWLNNATADGAKTPGIALCVDLSATPFYIKGSGHPEGRPFPWLVNDFGLVDAIESGIVKIPRLPVLDTTGRPDPKYFRLWRAITDGLQPAERLPGRAGRPKPDVVYREAEAALKQIAGQWVERFQYIQQASPGQERVPPVLILVCDNTDIAEVFFRKISGESEEEIVTEADVRELNESDDESADGESEPAVKKVKPKNAIRCDIGKIEPLIIEPNREPTATFLQPTVGFREGSPAQASPFSFVKQNRQAYYNQTHLQEIQFQIAKGIVDQLTENSVSLSDAKRRALKLQSRHQLFPQVLRFVQQYVDHKVDFRGENPCELGLEKYVARTIERLRDAILPDDEAGEPPLLPILNRYKPLGTTAEINFKTTRACWPTQKSHIDQIVLDTQTWESSAGFRLEQCEAVRYYVRNDHLGLTIPYEYQGVDHAYEPDFLVRLANNLTVVLEIKGYEDDQTKAKHNAARRWVDAVNNWRELGRWYFHVCHDPQILEKELAGILKQTAIS